MQVQSRPEWDGCISLLSLRAQFVGKRKAPVWVDAVAHQVSLTGP